MDGIDALRLCIERRQKRTLWTRAHFVTPRLLTRQFGDGNYLLGITPTNYRPNYYVVCGDSEWFSDSDAMRERLDEVTVAIADEFGEVGESDKERWPFPAWNGEAGYSFFAISWLEIFETNLPALLKKRAA